MQETFDAVAKHLLTQGCVSTRNGICAYRGEDGRKCAAGILIPDEKYRPEMEGKMAIHPKVSNVLQRLRHNVGLCLDLQLMHDLSDPSRWPKKLRSIARQYGLNTAVIESKA
jgi:hypothetical protein